VAQYVLFSMLCGVTLANFVKPCYAVGKALRHRRKHSGWPFFTEGQLLAPRFSGKGGCPMVTYSDMFTYTLVIIGIIGLIFQIKKK